MKEEIHKYLNTNEHELNRKNRKIAYFLLSAAIIIAIMALLINTLLPDDLKGAFGIQNNNEEEEEPGRVLAEEDIQYAFNTVNEMKSSFPMDQRPSAYEKGVSIYLDGNIPGIGKFVQSRIVPLKQTIKSYCRSTPNPNYTPPKSTCEATAPEGFWEPTNAGYLAQIAQDEDIDMVAFKEYLIDKKPQALAKMIKSADFGNGFVDNKVIQEANTYLTNYLNKQANECESQIIAKYESLIQEDTDAEQTKQKEAAKDAALAAQVTAKQTGKDTGGIDDIVVGLANSIPLKLIAQTATGGGSILNTVGKCVQFAIEKAVGAIVKGQGVEVPDSTPTACPVIPSGLKIPKVNSILKGSTSVMNKNLLYLPGKTAPDAISEFLTKNMTSKVSESVKMDGMTPQVKYMSDLLIKMAVKKGVVPQMEKSLNDMDCKAPDGAGGVEEVNTDDEVAVQADTIVKETLKEAEKASAESAMKALSLDQFEKLRLEMIKRYSVPIKDVGAIFNAKIVPKLFTIPGGFPFIGPAGMPIFSNNLLVLPDPSPLGPMDILYPTGFSPFQQIMRNKYLPIFEESENFANDNSQTQVKPSLNAKIPVFYLKQAINKVLTNFGLPTMKIEITVVTDKTALGLGENEFFARLDIVPEATVNNPNGAVKFDVKIDNTLIGTLTFNATNWNIPQRIALVTNDTSNQVSITLNTTAQNEYIMVAPVTLSITQPEEAEILSLLGEIGVPEEEPAVPGFTEEDLVTTPNPRKIYTANIPSFLSELKTLINTIINQPQYQLPAHIQAISILPVGNEGNGFPDGTAGRYMQKVVKTKPRPKDPAEESPGVTYRTILEAQLVEEMSTVGIETGLFPKLDFEM